MSEDQVQCSWSINVMQDMFIHVDGKTYILRFPNETSPATLINVGEAIKQIGVKVIEKIAEKEPEVVTPEVVEDSLIEA